MSTKKPIKSIDYSTGELHEEINERAKHLAESIISINKPFRRPFDRVRTSFQPGSEPSMTHQAHKDSCDINNIISQFNRTGFLPPSDKVPVYDDVSSFNRPLSELAIDAHNHSNQFQSDMTTREKVLAKKAADEKAAATKNPPPPSTPTPTPPPTSIPPA